jgi:peptidoglycan/xylan/chitin deacetylase (PgdA/CDA1 family)
MTTRSLVLILTSLLAVSPALAADQPGRGPEATILCYHIVESPHDPHMEVSREAFLQQITYLTATGYNIIPLADLYSYIEGRRSSLPPNPVVVTADDGWRSTYTELYPEMKRHHFPFTVFVYPKIIGKTAYALTWSQIREMAGNGADIESHSLSHPFLTQRHHSGLDQSAYTAWLRDELVRSKRIIEKETGRPVRFLAYPYGDYDVQLARTVAGAGYTAAVTCDFGRVHRGSDPMRLRRVVINKQMSFAAFRHYLGANPLHLEEPFDPAPDPDRAVLSAKIAEYREVDPDSVRLALLSPGTVPFSYDSNSGAISLEVPAELKGTEQRAIVWARDAESGKRLESVWSFCVPASADTSGPGIPQTGTPGAWRAAGGAHRSPAAPPPSWIEPDLQPAVIRNDEDSRAGARGALPR